MSAKANSSALTCPLTCITVAGATLRDGWVQESRCGVLNIDDAPASALALLTRGATVSIGNDESVKPYRCTSRNTSGFGSPAEAGGARLPAGGTKMR